MSDSSDPYKILKVARTATSEAIKKAYRKLALRMHPDRNPGDKKAEEAMKALNEAHAKIGSPETRMVYDYTHPDPETRSSPPPPRPPRAPRPPRPPRQVEEWETVPQWNVHHSAWFHTASHGLIRATPGALPGDPIEWLFVITGATASCITKSTFIFGGAFRSSEMDSQPELEEVAKWARSYGKNPKPPPKKYRDPRRRPFDEEPPRRRPFAFDFAAPTWQDPFADFAPTWQPGSGCPICGGEQCNCDFK